MCIRIHIFNSKRKKKQQQQQQQQQQQIKNNKKAKRKKTKREERISVENLMVYDDIVCEFAMSTLTDLIFSWISPGCSYEFIVVYVPREKSKYTTTKYEVNTFKNKIKKENQSDKFFFIIFSFISVYLLLQICYHRNICLRHSTSCKHDDFINNSKYILGPGRKYALVFYNKSCF